MIHCIYCEKALEDDASFCSACGKRVILESKESGRSESQGGSGKMSLDAMLAKESESPSAELEWQIGDSYFSGTNGAVKDYGEAVRWLEKASSRKHPAAQYALACCYANGLGTEKSDEAAFSLFRVAEENGFAGASLNVAQCFAEGRGVQKNPFRAAVRYIRMILDGDAQAVSRLRALYDSGENLVSDISESYRDAHLIRKKETEKNMFSKVSDAFSQDILKRLLSVAFSARPLIKCLNQRQRLIRRTPLMCLRRTSYGTGLTLFRFPLPMPGFLLQITPKCWMYFMMRAG